MKYIIGDVHGTYNTLIKLLEKLPPEANSTNIIFVGDLIDRGPDSRKVINFVRDGGYDIVKGNHEALLIEAWDEYKEYKIPVEGRNMWTQNGGDACLANYTIDGKIDYKALEIDVEWLRNLPEVQIYSEEVDEKDRKLVITHACSIAFIESYIAYMSKYNFTNWETLDVETEHRLNNLSQLVIWNRNIPLSGSKNFFNISGHNIIDNYIFNRDGKLKIPEKYITPEHILVDEDIGYACIDTGAFDKNSPGGDRNCEDSANLFRGKMTCIEFPSLVVHQQCNSEEFNWRT